jgi:RND family efflux transporter MFP subunit
MRLHISILLLSLYALTFSSGCQHADSQMTPPPIAVSVRVVSPADDPRSQIYSATLQPNREVAVAFQVTGYVEAIKQVLGADGRMRNIQQGDPVKAGELLTTVRSDTYKAQVMQLASQLISAQAADARAARDFQRDSELYAKHVIANSEYDYAMQQSQTAKAQVGQAEGALRQGQITLGYCKLVSPMDGVVLDRKIEIGSLVQANTVAFRIADTQEMKAVFGVSDIQIGQFKTAQLETLTSDALPGHPITGKITRIDLQADPTTRGFDVEVTVPNSDGKLRIGMVASLDFAHAMVPSSTVPMLPLAAIVRPPQDLQGFAVYAAEDQNGHTIARLRKVQLGPIVGNEITVSSGVQAGERVIIRGATMVTDGAEVSVIP